MIEMVSADKHVPAHCCETLTMSLTNSDFIYSANVDRFGTELAKKSNSHLVGWRMNSFSCLRIRAVAPQIKFES